MTPTGERREKIAFDEISQSDTTYGIVAGQWDEQFRRACRVKPLRGSEPVIAQRLVGVQPVVITLLSSTESRRITTAWRARHVRSGTVYQIRAVTPDEKRREIDLLCEAGSPVEDGS